MKDFLFKFFKSVNQLLKEKHYSKVIYSEETQNFELGVLFKLWAHHKGISLESVHNPS